MPTGRNLVAVYPQYSRVDLSTCVASLARAGLMACRQVACVAWWHDDRSRRMGTFVERESRSPIAWPTWSGGMSTGGA